ncbi:hypothetical protein SEA_DAEGAL_75 [Mycobacterium phage Daegal]|uniref:Uncharacterized protein n=1 Tax=Mycobacterium phage Daegal TaxID=2517946 RepID=A0A482MDG9_9CAUD|nr:hypothetical protein SEA_DAEGAL_75 [Mycobacterium phage Daegal]
MMSDQRPNADTCRDCGRTGRDRDGCNCIRDAFNALARVELADERPRCECACTGANPHADRLCNGFHGQRRLATQMVAIHVVGSCNAPAPDIDPDGNLCAFMCTPCANHAYAVTRRKINELLAILPPGSAPVCPTCHRDIARPEYVIARRLL